jgi:rapamycin-insensitive companion of mTOR
VLGLISGTLGGVQILSELGWDSVLTTMGTPTGLCVPRDPSKFLSLPPTPATPAPEPSSRNPTDLLIPFPPLDAVDTQIIETITNMFSVVHAKEATRTLLKLKQRHPTRFKRKYVWLGMLRCLEKWTYPISVRKFLFDFFGQRGMIRAIGRLEETVEESEEAEESEDDAENDEVEQKPVESVGHLDV